MSETKDYGLQAKLDEKCDLSGFLDACRSAGKRMAPDPVPTRVIEELYGAHIGDSAARAAIWHMGLDASREGLLKNEG